MLLTMFLLGLVYAVLIGVLIAAGAGAITVALIAALLFGVQLFTSDKIALFSMGAREVSPQQAPELHAIIERLCVQANLPKPRVAIAETAMPNAFAVGRSPKSATVCCTTGILSLLSPGELEAVLGHELTHVQNRDVVVMTVASFFASIAAFITQMGFWFGGAFNKTAIPEHGRPGVHRRDPRLGGRVRDLVAAAAGAVSLPRVRRRPRLGDPDRAPERADLRAAQDQRQHGARPQAGPARRLLRAGRVLHLPAEGQGQLASLFSTHPPLEKRIAALQRLEAQLQGTA